VPDAANNTHTHECHERTVQNRLVILVCVALGLLIAVPRAAAQEMFPRFDIHFDGQYLVSDDPRFNWAFDLGGAFDVVDWGRGRATFTANYEAMAGEQFRRFDVNQGNYLLEGAATFRLRHVEVAAVWHHVSRHLSDRPKRFPIDWNMIAGRVAGNWSRGTVAATWQTNVRKTVTNAYVDYDWEFESAATMRAPFTPRYGATAAANVRVIGVDGSRGRGTQVAGRVEAGVRLTGGVAAAELFVGVERRVDPYPLEFGTANWFLAGLRLLSR
jgi:hypothetical protein